MNKQIKDGIEVSQCEHYSIEYNSCNRTISGSCIKENCQTFRLLQTLKAKEQECKQLRGELWAVEENLKDYVEHYNRQCKQLDQLKDEKWALVSKVELETKSKEFFEERVRELEQEHKKLKQTLIEIKEIAEALDCKNPEKCWVNDISITGDCWGCEPDKYEEPRDLADCPSHLAHIILQKISEVEE